MGNLEYARCPNDGTVAVGFDNVVKKFGHRLNGKYLMVQSWCRECRKQR